MEQDKRFSAPIYAQIKAEKERTVQAAHSHAPRTPLGLLTSALGTVGFVLYYILFMAIAYAPLLFLGFPWWANILIIIGIIFIPFAGRLVELLLWVWAFFLVVNMPVSFKAVLFYVGAFMYIAFVLIPRLIGLFMIE